MKPAKWRASSITMPMTAGKWPRLAVLEAAIAVATEELGGFLADQVRNGYLDLGMPIEISDEGGKNPAAVNDHEVVRLSSDD
jgi:hypothetical protein